MQIEPGSFRDRDGFILYDNGSPLRVVQKSYQQHYQLLKDSKLLEDLFSAKLLIPHTEINPNAFASLNPWLVLQPQPVPFISYPYEWSFSQLKDAALLTLKILKLSLQKGMTLKDASAFNVQFINGQPVFIDTLSFSIYKEGEPWFGYEQFCKHFISPLLLMKYVDVSLNKLLTSYIDGIPLKLTSQLLPISTWFSPSILTHIHLHSRQSSSHRGSAEINKIPNISKTNLTGFIDHLFNFVDSINLPKQLTNWTNYYSACHYDQEDFQEKELCLNQALNRVNPKTVWDIGANEGYFSKKCAQFGSNVVAFDSDPLVIEKLYGSLEISSEKILPLQIDLCAPTPSIGWNNQERRSLLERGPSDLAIAFALVHHLRISNNIPFSKMSELFKSLCKYLLIEFVPEDDPKSCEIKGPFYQPHSDYNLEQFRQTFRRDFEVQFEIELPHSKRVIFLMKSN